MTNTFDITAFGAIGDGKTDCTNAIQSALDKAGETSGCVIVPAGVYATGKLTMRPNTRIEGKSAWSFRADGLSVLKLNDADANCLIDITGAFACSINGICLDGGRLGKNTHGVYLYWEKYNGGGQEDTPTIDDCRIGNFSGDGVHLEHVWCFSIRHSMLHRNEGCGLYIDGWDAFILDNWFTANENSGILGGANSSSITATGNRVEWNTVAGFRFKRGDAVNVTGNFFDRTFGPALWLGGKDTEFRETAVTGNVFRRNGCSELKFFTDEYQSSHVYLQRASNVTIVGNTFKNGVDDHGEGQRSPDYGIVVLNADSVIVNSNAMKESAVKTHVVWDNKGNCVFRDNLS